MGLHDKNKRMGALNNTNTEYSSFFKLGSMLRVISIELKKEREEKFQVDGKNSGFVWRRTSYKQVH